MEKTIMAAFASQPPSGNKSTLTGFFRGGMMPAAPMDVAALIIIDIRSLRLPVAEGKELEKEIREFLFSRLEKRINLTDRSAVDLSSSVFGIAIE